MTGNRLDVLRTLDKADKVGPIGIFDLLTNGRRDASGAFIQGCGLDPSQACVLAAFVSKDKTIFDRVQMLAALEDAVLDLATGRTALDIVIEACDTAESLMATLDDLVARVKTARHKAIRSGE